MRKTPRTTTGLAAAVFVVASIGLSAAAPPAAASHDVTPARAAGPDRIATAADVAALAHPDGASTALLARADHWPDALAGVPLAGLLDAPILLTNTHDVPLSTSQALADLAVDDIILLGGPGAISESVEQELAQGYAVERIAGLTHYGTAAAVARAVNERGDIGATPGGMRSAFLASGTTFPDALAVGAPAALEPNPMPVLLTDAHALPAETSSALDDLPIEQVLITGGTAAISEAVAQQLEGRGLNVVRLAGPTRTHTAAAVADFAVDVLPATPEVVHIARSDAFPDALTAGPLAAKLRGPLLLAAETDKLGEPAAQWLAARCPEVMVVRAVGGDLAVTTAVLNQAEQAAQRCHPRADRLAFLSRSGDPIALVTTRVPDGDDTVLTSRVMPAGGYDWSPDGTEIVYSRFVEGQQGASELVIVAADGSRETVVTSAGTDDRHPAFSPDGQRIVFTRGPATGPDRGLYIVNRDGSGLGEIIAEAGARVLFPMWSPDGQRIVYGRFPDGGEPQVAVIHATGADRRVIAERAVRPRWSPDGARIGFVSSQAPGQTSQNLHTVRPDGTDLRQLAADVAPGLAWSPDSELIAFSTRAGDITESDLAVVGRDGAGQRTLADVRRLDGSATWSPDGGTIAFVAAEVEGASDVYTVNVDGSDVRAVTSTGAAESPHFAPR